MDASVYLHLDGRESKVRSHKLEIDTLHNLGEKLQVRNEERLYVAGHSRFIRVGHCSGCGLHSIRRQVKPTTFEQSGIADKVMFHATTMLPYRSVTKLKP
jgi:hypothetical protein